MPRVTVNGVELYYEAAGEGEALVFVHGGFASLASALNAPPPHDWTWEHDFARCFRFVWYDRRGCYRSAPPADGYDLENQATDLEALMDRLGIAATHLVGSSAGGPIALLFAATRPSRVRTLILVGTGLALFPQDDPAGATVRQLFATLERDGPEAAFDQRPAGFETSLDALWDREEMAARGRLQDWMERQHALAARARDLPRRERVHRFAVELRNIAAYVDADLRQYARCVAAPTLVLHGSDDRVVPPSWGRELARAIPTAQLRVFPGGHRLLFRGPMSDEARRAAIEFARRRGRDCG